MATWPVESSPTTARSSAQGNRPVVAVSIVVEHTRGFDRPPDTAELAVLNAIRSNLSELGISAR